MTDTERQALLIDFEEKTRPEQEAVLDALYRSNPFPPAVRKIRTVALIGKCLTVGGVERVLSLLVPILRNAGYQIVLLLSEPPTDKDFPLPEDVTRITLPPGGRERTERLRAVLCEKNIDAVFHHLYCNPVIFQDFITTKRLGLPFVMTFHSIFTSPLLYLGCSCLPFWQTAAMADRLLVLTHMDENFFNRIGARAQWMPNPLTFPVAENLPERTAKTSPVILFPAQIGPEKQPEEAVKIFAGILREIPDAVLEIAGREERPCDLESLRNAIRALHVEKHVRLLGYRTDMPAVYARADLMLMTSSFEGFGLTLMEAKAVGLPVTAYELPYLETMKPGTGVRTVTMYDAAGAAREAVRLLKNPRAYAELSREGRQSALALARFDFQKKYTGIFQSLENAPENAPEKPDAVLQTILSGLNVDFKKLMRRQYREGAADKAAKITSGLTYRLGHALLALPILLKDLFMKRREK